MSDILKRIFGNDHQENNDGGTTVIDRPPALDAVREEAPALPPMYAVMLHNDATTNPLFVMEVLEEVFAVAKEKAYAIMIAAHRSDKACVEIYSKDMAETRAAQAMAVVAARGAGQNAFDPRSPCELTFTTVQETDGGPA